MVATPKFHVTQDAAWVFVHVHVPFVRVSDMEFYVDGVAFTFYCKPYLLKLHLPFEVVDDELAKAVYDPNKENGTIVVHLLKKEPGQHFPDLDLLTKLLQPQRLPASITANKQVKAPLIEVLESSNTATIDTFQKENDNLNALIDGKQYVAAGIASVHPKQTDSTLLQLEPSTTTTPVDTITLAPDLAAGSSSVQITDLAPSYGFNNAYSNFFRVWHGEVSEILSLPDPDNTRPAQRRILREKAEEAMFDIERYLMDVANQQDDIYFELAMSYEPFWRKFPVLASASVTRASTRVKVTTSLSEQIDSDIQSVSDSIKCLDLNVPPLRTSSVTFTDTEQELLLRLPRKEFLLPADSLDEKQVLGGLVDILISFAYEQLTTQGDSGVESTWTISILSPTLSWLDSNADLRAVVRSTVRRMITYPFLRQYDLAVRCVQEASDILKRGKRVVLRALLTLYRIVEKSETQYLLNALYIQDYCVWIQSVMNERLQQVSIELDAHIAAFTKSETGWALEELERSLIESDHEHDSETSESQGTSSGEEEPISINDVRDETFGHKNEHRIDTTHAVYN